MIRALNERDELYLSALRDMTPAQVGLATDVLNLGRDPSWPKVHITEVWRGDVRHAIDKALQAGDPPGITNGNPKEVS